MAERVEWRRFFMGLAIVMSFVALGFGIITYQRSRAERETLAQKRKAEHVVFLKNLERAMRILVFGHKEPVHWSWENTFARPVVEHVELERAGSAAKRIQAGEKKGYQVARSILAVVAPARDKAITEGELPSEVIAEIRGEQKVLGSFIRFTRSVFIEMLESLPSDYQADLRAIAEAFDKMPFEAGVAPQLSSCASILCPLHEARIAEHVAEHDLLFLAGKIATLRGILDPLLSESSREELKRSLKSQDPNFNVRTTRDVLVRRLQQWEKQTGFLRERHERAVKAVRTSYYALPPDIQWAVFPFVEGMIKERPKFELVTAPKSLYHDHQH